LIWNPNKARLEPKGLFFLSLLIEEIQIIILINVYSYCFAALHDKTYRDVVNKVKDAVICHQPMTNLG
jgi:hypothetical protein